MLRAFFQSARSCLVEVSPLPSVAVESLLTICGHQFKDQLPRIKVVIVDSKRLSLCIIANLLNKIG